MSTHADNIHDVLSAVAKRYSLADWKCVHREFSSIGQNYFGTLIPVTLSGKQHDEDINIHLVLKLAPFDERYRVSGALTQFFTREIFVYSTVLQKYQEIQQSFPKFLHFVFPKCHYIRNEYCKEVIVMQDMCFNDYEPFNDTFMDLNHLIISLKSLARFHALSFILKERDLQSYKDVEKVCIPLTEKTNRRFMDILKDRLMKAKDKLQNTKYVATLEYFHEKYVDLVESAYLSVLGTCICHGDLWKENILFQYEKNLPKSACLIDYQTTRISSPAFDVLFLIASSTDQHLRQKHFNYVLDVYYFSFDECLKVAGIDSKKVYPQQAFQNDLQVVGPACFIVANTALWLANGLQQEGHVRSKTIFATNEEMAVAECKYKTVIKNILHDFSCSGFISII